MTVLAKVEDFLLTPITTKTSTVSKVSLAQEAAILQRSLAKSLAALVPIYGRSSSAIRGYKCGFDKSVVTGSDIRQPCPNNATLVFRYDPARGNGLLYICNDCIKFCAGNSRNFTPIEEIVNATYEINRGYTLLTALNLFVTHLETVAQNSVHIALATGERRLMRS